jgi:phosphoglycolate phosphatase
LNLFLDLDGTLIDSRERLFRLFSFLVPQSKMTFDEYWDKKQNGIGHNSILKNQFCFSDESIIEFQKCWFSLIEKPEWIVFDKPFAGVTEKLTELKEKHNLILVTARQYIDVVHTQIASFNWGTMFASVLVTQQKMEKDELILQHISVTKEDWFIGDTGKDIQAGKLLGINTAGVLSGFLNRSKIEGYCPDIVMNDILGFNY